MSVLYAISTLHLLFIPTLALVGHLVTETRVVLTYKYVVYFGADVRSDRELSNDAVREFLTNNRRVREFLTNNRRRLADLSEYRTESYIKEREPQKEVTILPPAPPKESLQVATVPLSPSDRVRVPREGAGLDSPKRTETRIIGGDYHLLLLGVWVSYYLINSAYLAIGLARAHRMSAAVLFGLAVVGPPAAIVLLGAIGFLLLWALR